jgi:NADPH2:quinone reductase
LKALVFDRFGGPEVLAYRDVPDPELTPGRALVRTRAIGLNFADVYRRRGSYHLAGDPPYIAGYEAAGVVAAVDRSGAPTWEREVAVGDRVAFADAPFANAELVSVPLDRLVPIPTEVSFETAAAVLLQGLTAQYLVRDSHRIADGERVLIHAAAGGVGLLLIQLARLAGAEVLGVVSSEPKRAAALAAGASRVALFGEPWVEEALAFGPGGNGVDVAYDSVGSTLRESLRATRNGGHVVFFGMAGGEPEPVDPRYLMDTSKSLTGGDLWNVLTGHGERLSRAAELFDGMRAGKLEVRIAREFPLADGAAAHAFLESRASIGKVLLIP